MKLSILLVVCAALNVGITGCGGASGPAQDPSQAPPQSGSQSPAPTSGEPPAGRPTLTAQACEASGGALIGDIGDGAIHRPEYRCPNGAKPTGSIAAAEGGPMAIEGSVCCPR
ncbi:MAG TPA: hypothetical protein VJV79_01435 [Polyangiaceae bacterium]|nr:hypothetical protein [Polyangiaceae bacterium]